MEKAGTEDNKKAPKTNMILTVPMTSDLQFPCLMNFKQLFLPISL